MFSQPSQSGPSSSLFNGSLFGQSAATPATQTTTGNTSSSNLFGGVGGGNTNSVFNTPANTAATDLNSQNPALSSVFLDRSRQQTEPAVQNQQTGAYFDTLLAKSRSRNGGDDAAAVQDLPALQLGLGDLRQRLRALGARSSGGGGGIGGGVGGLGVDRVPDSRAQYLLASAGVDPSVSTREIGMLDLQEPRAERPVDTEVDIETYLSNLQTKTTLSMIAEGLDRSARDFDDFLEDNVTAEWDAQRSRIYEHFGIGPRDQEPAAGGGGGNSIAGGGGGGDSSGGRESTPSRTDPASGAFGRSRRSRTATAGTPSRAAPRASAFARSNMQRSVIGTPTKIGSHPSGFADVERATTDPSAPPVRPTDDRQLRDKQAKLAEKVRALNEARLARRPYPILFELAGLEARSPEPHAPYVAKACDAVAEMIGEDPDAVSTVNNATAKERQFAAMYMEENSGSADAVAMRSRILQGANRHLERQFMRDVDALIARHPHEARLGGVPDAVSKMRAYVRLKAARRDLVPDNTELQQVDGEYVWAVVFYLLRAGHVAEAATYVNENTNAFRGIDRTFPTYLNNYAAADDRRLNNRRLQDRIANEYTQRYRNDPDSSVDPFRMACYKVLGRCDLSRRSFDGLNPDVNEWIWLQFNLAREGDRSVEIASEAYGLSDVQASVKEIGRRHFPRSAGEDGADNGSFGMFFYMQVLAGLFEDAVAYLYAFSYPDAVHFGVALTLYGLLRPSDAISAGGDLRTHNTRGSPLINFGRMIGYYTRDFRAADVVSAVDYLALICLNADLAGEAGRRHAATCHEALRELVLETREFSRLIGDVRPDGRRITGIIEECAALVGLADGDDFVNTVTLQAASAADDTGRTTDSVLLYHLAGEYDTVVAIVSRALSEAISLEIGEDPMRLAPVLPRVAIHDNDHRDGGREGKGKGNGAHPAQQQQQQQQQQQGGTSLSLAALDDPVELAQTMMTMYERDAMFRDRIQDQNRIACRVLLEMSTIKGMVEAGQWPQSIDRIRNLDILPIGANGDPSLIRAFAARFTTLSQPVAINVPNLITWTVLCCIRQREELTSGRFSGNEGTRRMMVQQMRQITLDLMAYTSQLRYRFPPHLNEALARAAAE